MSSLLALLTALPHVTPAVPAGLPTPTPDVPAVSERATDATSIVWEGFAAALVQLALVVGGGIWAYRQYRRRREYRPHVRVGISARVARPSSGPQRLHVRLHIVNEANGHSVVNSLLVLWSVTIKAGFLPTFSEVARDFPFDYVHGWPRSSDGVMASADGTTLRDVTLEPSECVETEVVFTPDPFPKGVMAVRAIVEQARSRRSWQHPLTRRVIYLDRWEAFAFLDPAVLATDGYVAVTSHESGSGN